MKSPPGVTDTAAAAADAFTCVPLAKAANIAQLYLVQMNSTLLPLPSR